MAAVRVQQRNVSGWDQFAGFFSGAITGWFGGAVNTIERIAGTVWDYTGGALTGIYDTFVNRLNPKQIWDLNLVQPFEERMKRRAEMIKEVEDNERANPSFWNNNPFGKALKGAGMFFASVIPYVASTVLKAAPAAINIGTLGLLGAARGAQLGVKHGATGIGLTGAYRIMSNPYGRYDAVQNEIVGAAPVDRPIPQAAQQQLEAANARIKALEEQLNARPPAAAPAVAAAAVRPAPARRAPQPQNELVQEITKLRKEMAAQNRAHQRQLQELRQQIRLQPAGQPPGPVVVQGQAPAPAPGAPLAPVHAPVPIQPPQPNVAPAAQVQGPNQQVPQNQPQAVVAPVLQPNQGQLLAQVGQNAAALVGQQPQVPGVAPPPIAHQANAHAAAQANAAAQQNVGNQNQVIGQIVIPNPNQADFSNLERGQPPVLLNQARNQMSSSSVDRLVKAISLTQGGDNAQLLTLTIQAATPKDIAAKKLEVEQALRNHATAGVRLEEVRIGNEVYYIGNNNNLLPSVVAAPAPRHN